MWLTRDFNQKSPLDLWQRKPVLNGHHWKQSVAGARIAMMSTTETLIAFGVRLEPGEIVELRVEVVKA